MTTDVTIRVAHEMSASTFIATSLDGFIARADGAIDWLPEGGGEPHGYDEYMAGIDAVVIGRKTFETVRDFPSWPYERPVFVLSSRPQAFSAPPGVACEFLCATPASVVRTLSERGFERLYVDGGVTVHAFLAAGLLARLIITRVPVIIGGGIPLFGWLPHDIRLRHIATRSYPSGLVCSEYAPLVSP
jgi:dihydrofolate reductase